MDFGVAAYPHMPGTELAAQRPQNILQLWCKLRVRKHEREIRCRAAVLAANLPG